MFLFRSSAQQEAKPADHPLARPLRSAAEATGISFDYLLKTAKRESNLNPDAKAPNSSATGLFQFIEQTWLGLVKREGAKLGLGEAASEIQQDRSGRFVVPDAAAKKQILALRKDPDLSARLAGTFTQQNREVLRNGIKREPNSGELYMAHFLGAQGASEMIQMAEASPTASAARAFPDAASANRSIFFDGKGRARTVREVYARLVSQHQGEAAMPTQMASASAYTDPNGDTPSRSPLAIAPARQNSEGAAFHGLFRNGGNSADAKALRKTWQGFGESRLLKEAPSFFPREAVAQVASVSGDQVMSPGTTNDVTAPAVGALAKFQALETPAVQPVKADSPQKSRSAKGAPLDLMKFLKVKR